MIDVGIYEVQYDEATNEYVVNDQIGQKGERRFNTVSEAGSFIEFDIAEVDITSSE